MKLPSKRVPRAVLLSVVFVASMNAAVIVNNGTPNQTGGTDLIFNLGADNFTLADSYIINMVRYWTLQESANSYTGPTQWSVLSDNGGSPGTTTVASGSFTATQAATGQSGSGLSEFEHTAAVNINLGPGTYWFALSSTSSPGSVNWAYTNNLSGDAQAYEIGVGPWGSISAELAFQLEGDAVTGEIPEPATFVFIGAGLIALIAKNRGRTA